MLEEQMEMNKRKKALQAEMKREEDLQELERIQRENEELEKRKLLEDEIERNKHKQFERDNILLQKQKEIDNGKLFNNETNKQKEVNETYYKASKDDLRNDVLQTMKEMEEQKEKLREQLKDDIEREKMFLKTLPDEIQKKITSAMNLELQRMKNEVNYGTNILRDQILKLRNQALEIDQERRKAGDDLHTLRSNLAKIQYQDDIRTQELLDALAEDNLNRILPSSSKFEMPEALFHDDTQNRFPIDYYEKDRRMKGEEKLYTDGYFLAEDSLDNYFRTDNISSNNKSRERGIVSQSLNFEPYRYDETNIGRIYEKNNERENFFNSALNNDYVNSYNNSDILDEYLEKDINNYSLNDLSF